MTKCMISSIKLGNIIKDISSTLRSIKLVSCNLDDMHTNKIFQAGTNHILFFKYFDAF
jgi:hypothetical protein